MDGDASKSGQETSSGIPVVVNRNDLAVKGIPVQSVQLLSPSDLEEVTLESPSSNEDTSSILGTSLPPPPPPPPSSPALIIHVGSSPEKKKDSNGDKSSPDKRNVFNQSNNNQRQGMRQGMDINSPSPSSSASSPVMPSIVPHKPRFSAIVKPFIPPAPSHLKEDREPGLFFTYLVQSRRLPVNSSPSRGTGGQKDDSECHEHPEEYVVKRVWEDFEFLHQCLTLAAFPSSNGLIIPPLPAKVVPSLESRTGVNAYDHLVKQFQSLATDSRNSSRHQSPTLGNSVNNSSGCAGLQSPPPHHHSSHHAFNSYVKAMISPDFRSDCFQLQEYLNLMVCHPVFGKNIDVWERFLTSEKPAPRIKAGSSSSSSSSSTSKGHFSSSMASNANVSAYASAALHHRDCDEFFQKERDWVHLYSDVTRECLSSLNSNLSAKNSKCLLNANRLLTILAFNYDFVSTYSVQEKELRQQVSTN